jgi:hypothetical protein
VTSDSTPAPIHGPDDGLGRRPIALLAAAAVLVGAGGPLGLYDGLGAGFDYGFSIQLARSTPVGATAVDDGFRVTIDRAYLDGERLMLAIRVTDERQREQITQVSAMYAVVSDANGVWEGAGGATSSPHGPWTAANVTWRLAPGPLPGGTHHLRVHVPHVQWRDASEPPDDEDPSWDPWHRKAGAWTFEIDLPVDGGATVVRPGLPLAIEGTTTTVDDGAPVEIGGVTLTVDGIVIGRSAIRVRLRHEDPATWFVVGAMERDGKRFPFVVEAFGESGVIDLQTDGGTDRASGTWSLVVDRIEREGGGTPGWSLAGPWRLEIPVP